MFGTLFFDLFVTVRRRYIIIVMWQRFTLPNTILCLARSNSCKKTNTNVFFRFESRDLHGSWRKRLPIYSLHHAGWNNYWRKIEPSRRTYIITQQINRHWITLQKGGDPSLLLPFRTRRVLSAFRGGSLNSATGNWAGMISYHIVDRCWVSR